MSLSSPHPIWRAAGSPFEVSKAVIVARMLSGRYRTDRLARHWTSDNPNGLCRLPGCSGQVGDLVHILLHCPALAHSREKMITLWSAYMVSRPSLLPVIQLLNQIFFLSSCWILLACHWLFQPVAIIQTPSTTAYILVGLGATLPIFQD